VPGRYLLEIVVISVIVYNPLKIIMKRKPKLLPLISLYSSKLRAVLYSSLSYECSSFRTWYTFPRCWFCACHAGVCVTADQAVSRVINNDSNEKQ
jgi:hypothetical protein